MWIDKSKSLKGIVIHLEQKDIFDTKDIIERYTQGGSKMAEIKLDEIQEEKERRN